MILEKILFSKKQKNVQANVINEIGIDEITISRFTYDAWQKCAIEDDLSYQAYEASQCPESLMDMYHDMKLWKVKNKDVRLQAIPIDGDYFTWLEKNGFEDSEAVRSKYNFDGLSPEAIKEKLNKNHMDVSSYLLWFVNHVLTYLEMAVN